MAQTIKLKRSASQGAIPTTSNLELGEVAINTYDGKMYIKKDDGTSPQTIIEISGAGGVAGGDFTFLDNEKAIFGTGSDLQIYHDGSNSYIADVGTGDLRISASANLELNGANGETLAKGTEDGKFKLYQNNILRLETTTTGIDVTGSATMDGLTVDNSGTAISITNGDGLTQLGKFLGETTDGFVIEGKANNNLTLRTKANTLGEGIKFQDSAGDNMMFIDGTTGDISFYEDTGTDAKFFWDASAESLGIGTTSPDDILHLSSTLGTTLRIESTATALVVGNNIGKIEFEGQDAGGAGVASAIRAAVEGTAGQAGLAFDTGSGGASAERVRIDADGNVGIGTSSPGEALEVVGKVEADEFLGPLRGAILFNAQADEALVAGDVVYISGISGNTTTVAKADADDAAKMPAFGLALAAANLNAAVEIVTFGSLSNIDTSTFSEGDELFVSTTAGGLVNSAPTGESAQIQKVAKVTRSDASVGSVKVLGAGRSNATPNLNTGRLFVGDANNQTVTDDTIYVDIANSRVGIGTASPDTTLHVLGSAQGSNNQAIIESNNGGGSFGPILNLKRSSISPVDNDLIGMLKFTGNNDAAEEVEFVRIHAVMDTVTDATEDGSLVFSTINAGSISEAMRIDSSGNVLVAGTSALTTSTSIAPTFQIIGQSAATGSMYISRDENSVSPAAIYGYKSRNSGAIVQDNDSLFSLIVEGSDGVGPIRAGSIRFEVDGTPATNDIPTAIVFERSDGAAGLNESMRIDASGNLLVGKTSTGAATAGIELNGVNDLLRIARDGGVLQELNRIGGDGDIIEFRKDNTAVGSIGTNSSNLVIGNVNAGIKFGSGASAIVPHSLATNTDVDDSIDLGTKSGSIRRFRDLYLSGTADTGTISSGDITTTGVLYGPSTFYIDPSPDDTSSPGGSVTDTGTVVILGDLQVTGTTTTIDSTTLQVSDLNITVAKEATSAAEANGAGLTVAGANATLTYGSTADAWSFNKDLDVTGNMTADSLTVEGAASVGGTYITSSSGSAAGDIKIEHIINSGRNLNTINSESGSGSAIGLAFATGDTERLRIDATGNVGINQADPQTKTHITAAGSGSGVTDVLTIQTTRSDVGTAFAGGAINFVNNDTNSAGQARIKVGSSNDAATIGLNSESAQSFIFETSTSGSISTSNIDGDATTITVTHGTYSGFVPGQRIAINTGTYQGGYFIDTVTSDTEFTIADTDHDLAADSSGTPTIQYAVPRDSMIIRADGNVGIGTNSPESSLHVSAAVTHAAGTEVARIENTATGEPAALAFTSIADNGGAGNEGAIYFDAGADGTAADNQLQFNADHQTNTTPDMVITGDGKVGIGTTSPDANLQIGDFTGSRKLLLAGANATSDSSQIIFTDASTQPSPFYAGMGIRYNSDTNKLIIESHFDTGVSPNATTQPIVTFDREDQSATFAGDISASNLSGTNTGDETQASINALAITEVGTITSGTWNGTAIASAYLDADTAHLSGTQTFSGEKTFSSDNGIFIEPVTNGAGATITFSDNSGGSFAQNGTLAYFHVDGTVTSTGGNSGDGWIFDGTETRTVVKVVGDIEATSDAYIGGTLTATSKSFDIEHPTKPNHRLRYGSLEGPENGVYVRGRMDGEQVIELPDYWLGLVHEDTITVSLTAIGPGSVWVESIENNVITVGGSEKFFYHVFAERKDIEKLVVEYENGDSI